MWDQQKHSQRKRRKPHYEPFHLGRNCKLYFRDGNSPCNRLYPVYVWLNVKTTQDSYHLIQYTLGRWHLACPNKFQSPQKAKDFAAQHALSPETKTIHSSFVDCLDLFPAPSYNDENEAGKSNQAIS